MQGGFPPIEAMPLLTQFDRAIALAPDYPHASVMRASIELRQNL
jgi:hypothetical protein